MLTLLENLERSDIRATLAVLDGSKTIGKRFPASMAVHDLGKRGRLDFLMAIRNLRRLIARDGPDVVISFLPFANVVTFLAARASSVPLVLNERTNTQAYLRFEHFGWVWGYLLSSVYRRVCRVVANTEMAGKFLVEQLGVDRERLCVFPNPVDSARISSQAASHVSHPWFQADEVPVVIGIGRLAAEKGFGRLIEAFAVVRRRIACRLVLLGEGPERSRLQRTVEGLGLAGLVTFLGFQENPYPLLARSLVLGIPSEFEGFPNVAVEAMVCGTPVVGFGGVGGLDEISDGGRAALLVRPQTATALAEALLRVMTDARLRSSLVHEGRVRARQYEVDKVLPAYFAVFRDAARGPLLPCADLKTTGVEGECGLIL